MTICKFDAKSGIRERLALLAAKGPNGSPGWSYDPRADRFFRFGDSGWAPQVEVKQEGSKSLEIIADRWQMSRREAMAFIGYPEQV